MSENKEKMTFGRAMTAPFRYLMQVGRGMGPWRLALSWLLLLAIPYGYLWLCGVVFDAWLKWYDGVVFIFVSLVTFWVINIIMGILFTVGFATKKNRKGGK